MASDQELFTCARVELQLGLRDVVEESAIFREHNGDQVLNGTIAVVHDGTAIHLQRCTTNLVPMISYLRQLRERLSPSSSSCPPLHRCC